MLCTFGKLIFQGIWKTMLPRLKILLSIVLLSFAEALSFKYRLFEKKFIAYYMKTYFLLNMKAKKLK